MGVLPLEFTKGATIASLGFDGTETFDLTGLSGAEIHPRQQVSITINRADGSKAEADLTLRIDTPIEIDFYKAGGILPFVLGQLLAE